MRAEPTNEVDEPVAPDHPRRGSAAGTLGTLFWLAVAWLVLVVATAVFAGLLPLPDPTRISPGRKYLPIGSDGHLLGTDQLGRDILARVAEGARISMFISLLTVAVGITVGGVVGTTVGYVGGRIEKAAMALVNMALSFPSLILLLGVIAFAGQSLRNIVLVFCVLAIPGYIRFARASTLTLKERDWVLASRMIGAKDRRIVFRVLLPDVLVTLITFGLLAIGAVIVAEGVIAFLGVGVPPPTATWGQMIADGQRDFDDDVIHTALIPATAMFLTILSLNLVGDGLRRRLQVREAQI